MTNDVAELLATIQAQEEIIRLQERSIGYLKKHLELIQAQTLPSLEWYPGADFQSSEPVDGQARTRFAYANRLQAAFEEFRSMSKALLESEPIDKSLLNRIDKVFCACIGLAPSASPRMYLLEAIQRTAEDNVANDPDYHINLALALLNLGHPISPAQQKLVDDNSAYESPVLDDGSELTKARWKGFLMGLKARADTYGRIRYGFARLYPEHAERLTKDDTEKACQVWTARGARKSMKDRPIKWEFLAGLMERIGLGRLSAKTLEQDWLKWAKSQKNRQVDPPSH